MRLTVAKLGVGVNRYFCVVLLEYTQSFKYLPTPCVELQLRIKQNELTPSQGRLLPSSFHLPSQSLVEGVCLTVVKLGVGVNSYVCVVLLECPETFKYLPAPCVELQLRIKQNELTPRQGRSLPSSFSGLFPAPRKGSVTCTRPWTSKPFLNMCREGVSLDLGNRL